MGGVVEMLLLITISTSTCSDDDGSHRPSRNARASVSPRLLISLPLLPCRLQTALRPLRHRNQHQQRRQPTARPPIPPAPPSRMRLRKQPRKQQRRQQQ